MLAKTDFNPRTHVGCDGFIKLTVSDTNGFQSTHPCGVRPIFQYFFFSWGISIHAPMWGATGCNSLGWY
ncbi:hypothetical protein ACYTYC_10005, partial [Streptococcus pyogenes]